MDNPYEVLGVSPNATDEEIRNAYREKARIYSQSSYDGDPLETVAAKKLKELDEAYDAVMAQRRSASGYAEAYSQTSDYSADNPNGSYSGYNPPTYAKIREEIKRNRLDEAQIMLDRIPEESRIAEWYYLQGMIQQKKGWANAAYENYERACRTDPSNPEYTRAYQSMNSQRAGGYRVDRDGRSGDSGCSFCNMCQGLICADCCCECMGGDLIPCC